MSRLWSRAAAVISAASAFSRAGSAASKQRWSRSGSAATEQGSEPTVSEQTAAMESIDTGTCNTTATEAGHRAEAENDQQQRDEEEGGRLNELPKSSEAGDAEPDDDRGRDMASQVHQGVAPGLVAEPSPAAERAEIESRKSEMAELADTVDHTAADLGTAAEEPGPAGLLSTGGSASTLGPDAPMTIQELAPPSRTPSVEVTGYRLFAQEVRSSVKTTQPEASDADVAIIIKQMYADLNDAMRRAYDAKAADKRRRQAANIAVAPSASTGLPAEACCARRCSECASLPALCECGAPRPAARPLSAALPLVARENRTSQLRRSQTRSHISLMNEARHRERTLQDQRGTRKLEKQAFSSFLARQEQTQQNRLRAFTKEVGMTRTERLVSRGLVPSGPPLSRLMATTSIKEQRFAEFIKRQDVQLAARTKRIMHGPIRVDDNGGEIAPPKPKQTSGEAFDAFLARQQEASAKVVARCKVPRTQNKFTAKGSDGERDFDGFWQRQLGYVDNWHKSTDRAAQEMLAAAVPPDLKSLLRGIK